MECALCHGTDFTQPHGAYRQAGYTQVPKPPWRGEPGSEWLALHLDCHDKWADAQVKAKGSTPMRGPKPVTSKPHKRNR